MAQVITDAESATGMTSSQRWHALDQSTAGTKRNHDDNQYVTPLLMNTKRAPTHTHTHTHTVQVTESLLPF